MMRGIASTFVCLAEPFKPVATLREVQELSSPPWGENKKGLYVEYSFCGHDGKEEDVGGRRAKVRYWWVKEDGLWKIILQHADDCGFEMKENWEEDFARYEKEQKEKGNWF